MEDITHLIPQVTFERFCTLLRVAAAVEFHHQSRSRGLPVPMRSARHGPDWGVLMTVARVLSRGGQYSSETAPSVHFRADASAGEEHTHPSMSASTCKSLEVECDR